MSKYTQFVCQFISRVTAAVLSGVIVYYLTQGRISQPPELPTSLTLPNPTISPIESNHFRTQSKLIYFNAIRNLLAKGQWKKADEYTTYLLLIITDRHTVGWLRASHFKNISCDDLRAIDFLWVYYSQGKFGLSVQKEIYQSLGGTSEYNQDVSHRFGERVGWRVNNSWLKYRNLAFNQKAKTGHLPTVQYWNGVNDELWLEILNGFLSSSCKL